LASVNCPHGHKWISRLGSALVIENRTIQIFDGICDSCDRCGFSACEYFDDSKDATRRFCQALGRVHASIEAKIQDDTYAVALRTKHLRLYGKR
jgi:hypothetical protein